MRHGRSLPHWLTIFMPRAFQYRDQLPQAPGISLRRGRPLLSLPALTFLFVTLPLFCQSNSGELRLKITGPDGLGLKSTVELISESNQLHKNLSSDDSGILVAKGLPFGIYKL